MTKTMLEIAARLVPGLTARWAARRFLTPRPVDIREDEFDVLETAARREIVADEALRLHAFVWGEDGPTVLLVHGWNGNVGQMTPFVRPLLSRGFRVVAYSAPAHGTLEGSTTHIPELARAVRAMARRFGPLHAIVAHSAGATAAARAFQRGVAVDRLALVAPATGPASWLSRFAAAARLTRIEPLLADAVEELAGACLAELELSAMAPALRVPVLALHDANDPLVPVADARRAVEAMPGGRFLETSSLGHFRILRDPAAVGEVVAFVAHGARDATALAS